MISPKLLLVLMVSASSMGAPQIRSDQVVENVISELTPAILQALGSINLGGFSNSNSRISSSLSAPAISSSRFSSSSASAPAISSSRFSTGTSGTSQSDLTSSVISSLQPSIAAAVAKALGGSRRSGSSFSGATGAVRATGANAEPDYGPAQYDFSYKVADDDTQAYISQQETREGQDVTGTYNYVDSTGSLVTVNYQAGPEGYTETRDVEKGSVQMRNIPVGWNGPHAGVDDVETSAPRRASTRSNLAGITSTRSQNTGLSQSDILSQIISSLTPQIGSAVQSALSSSSNFATNSASVPVQRPRVQRPVRVPVRQVSAVPTSNDLSSLFGVQGQNSVRIETPGFNIEY